MWGVSPRNGVTTGILGGVPPRTRSDNRHSGWGAFLTEHEAGTGILVGGRPATKKRGNRHSRWGAFRHEKDTTTGILVGWHSSPKRTRQQAFWLGGIPQRKEAPTGILVGGRSAMNRGSNRLVFGAYRTIWVNNRHAVEATPQAILAWLPAVRRLWWC